MKLVASIANTALAISLLSTGCKRETDVAQVVWIGNADLSEYSEVVADFSEAFASDPLCHGIRLETHNFPKEPYWFLETYPIGWPPSGDTHEPSDGISWWMVHHDHGNDLARFESHDTSSANAAHHVCFIIKGKGGDV